MSGRLRALSPTPTQHVQPVVPASWTQNTQVIDHMALLSFSGEHAFRAQAAAVSGPSDRIKDM